VEAMLYFAWPATGGMLGFLLLLCLLFRRVAGRFYRARTSTESPSSHGRASAGFGPPAYGAKRRINPRRHAGGTGLAICTRQRSPVLPWRRVC
jgi:hypothetical protein